MAGPDAQFRSMVGNAGVPITFDSLPESIKAGFRQAGYNPNSVSAPKTLKVVTESNSDVQVIIDGIAIVVSDGSSKFAVVIDPVAGLATLLSGNLLTTRARKVAELKLTREEAWSMVVASNASIKLPAGLDSTAVETARKLLLSKNNCADKTDLVDCQIERVKKTMRHAPPQLDPRVKDIIVRPL